MSKEEDFSVGFTLPSSIRDFVFDLHEAIRITGKLDDINRLYEQKYKEITDRYFPKSPWPDAKSISNEVRNDEVFLLLYGEMIMRHMTTKLKPQLIDHLNSWSNYKQLFAAILATDDKSFMITTPWIYDIMQEFAYQFQGFCQYRCQAANHHADALALLKQHADAWNLPEAKEILNKLISAGNAAKAKEGSGVGSTIIQQFGYFASIELARLDCLLGDYEGSLAAIAHIKITDRSQELFLKSPICTFNLLYHLAVAQMMLPGKARRLIDAMDTLTDVILYVQAMNKPGGSTAVMAGMTLRTNVPQQLHRMNERALSLLALLYTIFPSYRLEESIKVLLFPSHDYNNNNSNNTNNNPNTNNNKKYEEKMKRFASGDLTACQELFENACPKFISPMIPDYATGSLPVKNPTTEFFEGQVKGFVTEMMTYVPFLKVRSFLGLYTSIDIKKLARFTNLPEEELQTLLIAYQERLNSSSQNNAGDLHFKIEDGVLKVEKAALKADQTIVTERFFVAGMKKQSEIRASLNKSFTSLKL